MWGSVQAADADVCRRVYAYLTIRYPEGALEEVENALRLNPRSIPLAKARIEVLAALGQENAMLACWQELIAHAPEQKQDRELIEEMAWGIIRKGTESSNPLTVALALLAAQKGQDVRGVRLLAAGMRHPNSAIRALTVDLVSQMRDVTLQNELVRLIAQDKVWAVRLEAIRAIGRMKIREAQGFLEHILSDPATTAEETVAAVEASVNLFESMNPSKLHLLVHSKRAGLRLLACQVAVCCGEASDIDVLVPLLQDSNADVRAMALQTIGLIRVHGKAPCSVRELAARKLSDNDPTVALSAAWLLTLESPDQGMAAFRRWLNHCKQETRLKAVSALISTGLYGLPLLCEVAEKDKDPYVRLNVALGLIQQRHKVREACDALLHGLEMPERWMWCQKGIFRYVGPSEESQRSGVPNYPEAINQLVRLEMLNILAMMKSPHAQDAIRRFLTQRNWGISGVAATLLLAEGNEEAIELVSTLLDDPEPKVRMQAALAMGVLGGDARAVEVLQKSYPSSDRANKEKVIEAIGRIGRMESVPFLVDQLRDPHQNLRIAAASALLQCLNH